MFKKKSSKEKNAEDDVPPSPKSPQPTPSYGGQPDVGGEGTREQRANHDEIGVSKMHSIGNIRCVQQIIECVVPLG